MWYGTPLYCELLSIKTKASLILHNCLRFKLLQHGAIGLSVSYDSLSHTFEFHWAFYNFLNICYLQISYNVGKFENGQSILINYLYPHQYGQMSNTTLNKKMTIGL